MFYLYKKILPLALLACNICWGQMPCVLPFGSNNPFASSADNTSVWLNDLDICWVSDHLRRSKIEKIVGGSVVYDFSDIDPKITEYGAQANTNVWFIINTESAYQFLDGIQIGTSNKFIAAGDSSYYYYDNFIDTLVKYVNSKVPSWKVKYWSADNEHASLYVTAYCPGLIDTICGGLAAQEYSNLLEHTWNTIKAADTSAKIVYGGIGGGALDEEYDYYYIPSLKKLYAKDPNGFFDFFDFHDFNVYQQYKTNSRGKGLIYYRNLLQSVGFTNKPIIMKAGATHTGIDTCANNSRLQEYQTELQQSEYLFKRFVWNIANGVKLILYGDIREDSTQHDTYSYNGLIYNGIPDLSYCDTSNCDTSFFKPCPDPGDGIKKLSYYTFKLLNEKLKNFDFDTIDTVNNGNDNVYIYKLLNTVTSEPLWVVWWDYWNDSAITTKNTAIKTGNTNWLTAKITDAIPDFISGTQLNPSSYPSFFHDTIINIVNDTLYLSLKQSPIYIEKDLVQNISNGEQSEIPGKKIKIFPQPFSTHTTLWIAEPLKNATLTVENIFGQTVKQIKNINGQTITLYRDNLPNGIYFIHLTQDNKVIATNKIVISN